MNVLIPKPGTFAASVIDRGSGVVTAADPEVVEVLDVYYEGNRYNVDALRAFDERVRMAAARLTEAYPTVARGRFPAGEFLVVGQLVALPGARWSALMISDAAALQTWLGGGP